MNITKYKKLIMTEHKTDMNITKYKNLNMSERKTDMNIIKKLNSNSMMEHKTDMNITKYNTDHDRTKNRHEHYWIQNLNMTEHKTREQYWKTEPHFYRGIQNWYEHDWKTEQHFQG